LRLLKINRMKYLELTKIFFIICICIVLQKSVICQDDYESDTSGVNGDDEEYYQGNDSTDNVYRDYYRLTVSGGHSRADNFKLSSYSKQFYININYSYSLFPIPLEFNPTQLGFYNEIGLNNTSPYFNIGPELMIVWHFYILPYAGVSLVPFSKYNDEGLTVIYYAGAAAGCILYLNQDLDLIIEAATDFIRLKQDQNNTYLKVGISYNLFYPL
jgi:hypothetical protein